MKPFPNEATLAAYALDQLDESRRADVGKFVESDAAAQRTVAEYRQVASMAKEAVKSKAAHDLGEIRRGQIMREARNRQPRTFVVWRPLFLTAAALFAVVALASIVLSGTMRSGRQSNQAAIKAGEARERDYFFAARRAGEQFGRPVAQEGEKTGFAEKYEELGARRTGYDLNGDGVGTAPAAPQPDRYLVKTAVLGIETADARKAASDLAARAVQLGGYVANLKERTDDLDRHTVIIEVRVPADSLDGALQALDMLGKILNKQVTAQDVTEEYVDNESRIRNLKKTEERLLDHLSKTSMIENTLKIETELNRVREQLELLEGRHRVLSHRVAFSSINATFTETPKAGPIVPAQTFSAGKVSTEALRALVEFGRSLIALLIWIGVWTPVWAPMALVGWWLWRRLRRNWRL